MPYPQWQELWTDLGGENVDVYGGQRPPSDKELVRYYRDTAYFCANLNAEAVANNGLRLYVKTGTGQRKALCKTAKLDRDGREWVRKANPMLPDGVDVEEVTEHPVLALLDKPCEEDDVPLMSRYDLLIGTQLYLETVGRAYWHIETGVMGTPAQIWLLPSHRTRPVRERGSKKTIDYFAYGELPDQKQFKVQEVVFFRMLSLLDPYVDGYSPLEAAYERINAILKSLSQTQATLDNRMRFDSIISPEGEEGMIETERERLEFALREKFTGKGTGKPLISGNRIKIQPLQWSPKDQGELVEQDKHIAQIARCFDVPLSMLDRDANRASADAGLYQHARHSVLPRTKRLTDVLNSRLIPFYDPSGRLFFCSDNPVPEDADQQSKLETADLANGVRVINEIRDKRGDDAVTWGDEPWMSTTLQQPSGRVTEKEKVDAQSEAAEAALNARPPMNGQPGGPPNGKPPSYTEKAIATAISKFSGESMAEFLATREQLRTTGKIGGRRGHRH